MTDNNLFRSAASTLQAKSLAIVGASERAAWPSMIYKNLREFRYPGRIAFVNPRQTEVFGQRCYPSLRDLPEPVDHALVIVPAGAVPDVLTDGEAIGVKSATVYSAMMGDGDEPESKARGVWLKDFVAKSRLRVAGPNCMGAYSFRERLMGYPNIDLCSLEPGSVACLFQSGGTIMFWMRSAADRGLRYSYCVTSGNEPDLGLEDYLNFVLDDPHTKMVVLFIEGIRRPEAFMHAAGRALAMGKPILAIKTGITAKSQAASQSHTGAIAGDYASYLAMCERYGVINCRSLDDMVETALAFEGGRLPKGPRIGFITTSGGTVDLLYDYAEQEGAAIPDFSDATKATMKPMMQDGISPKNPLDIGIPPPMDVAAKVCEAAARDPSIDMVAWASPMPRRADAWGDMSRVPPAARRDGQAVPCLWPHDPSGQRATYRGAEGCRLPFSARPGTDAACTQRAVVLRSPIRPRAGCRAAGSAKRSDAGHARRHAGALRHRVAAVSGGRERRRSGHGGRTHRLPGGAENPLVRHPAQDGSRRRRAQSARPCRGGARGRTPGRIGAQGSAQCAHRRLPGAGDGVRRRGDRRRAQRRALRADAAGRCRRHSGRTRQGRRAAHAAGRCGGHDARWSTDSSSPSCWRATADGQPPIAPALEKTALALGQFFLDHRAKIADIEINPLMVRENGAVAVDVRVLWRNDMGA